MELDLSNYSQITDRFFYDRSNKIGGGAYGEVFKGYDNQKKRFIAVKRIPRNKLFGMPAGELKEISIMKKLKHPNIMEYFGSYGDKLSPDGIFMFLELCEGGLLGDLIALKMTELRAHKLFEQLVEGMVYMNEQRLFHRDLKPDNILLTLTGELKIADFGIAKQIQAIGATFKRCTPIYSAPEVYIQQIYERNKEGYNEKCDVFSAGYILYEMLTSEKLNKGIKTTKELTHFLKSKEKEGFVIDHPALSARWIKLIKSMLSFDPIQRPSFKEIRSQLQKFQPAEDKIPEVRLPSVEQKKKSEILLRKMRKYIEITQRRNNYFVGLLKLQHLYQQDRSELMPKVYKIIFLYLSLTRFCKLSEIGLRQIDDKENFEIPGTNCSISQIEQLLTLDDKVALTQFLKSVTYRINQGKEQIKLFLLGEILPQLTNIHQKDQNNPERIILEEYKLPRMEKLKVSEYQMEQFYSSGLRRCINNLYRTAAELQVLPQQDLRLYLVALYIAHIDSDVDTQQYETCNLPPSIENILLMDRKELNKLISVEKNKCMPVQKK